jgi:hypothetical protein
MKINLKLNGQPIIVEYKLVDYVQIEKIFFNDQDIKPILDSIIIDDLSDLIYSTKDKIPDHNFGRQRWPNYLPVCEL